MNELLDQLGINISEIERDIVEAAAHEIANDIDSSIARRIQERAQTMVNEKLGEIIEGVLENQFQPVNNWNEPVGEPTTIRDMITKSVTAWWETKVDSKGEVSSGYYNKQTRAEYYANKVVAGIVDYKLKKELEKYIEGAKGKIREAMSEAILKSLKSLL